MLMKPSPKWLKIHFDCPGRIAEAASDLIGVLSGVGVEIRPLPDRDKNTITGFFALDNPDGDDLDGTAAETLERVTGELEKLYAIYNLILSEPQTEIIDDEDWATSWQQFFSTFEIIPDLFIKPSWEKFTAGKGQHVITMDPGMAFGTGQHASTRLALGLIASHFENLKSKAHGRVLDVGTGTGILAMAGAVFGADQVMAIDNDPEAVRVACHNIHANYLDWNIGVSDKPLAEVEGRYDLICANIVHDVLVDMAPDLGRLLNRDGRIILSGILSGRQEENLEKVFGQEGMKLLRSEHDEEWTAMLLTRN